MKSPVITAFSLLSLAVAAPAASVVNWVTTNGTAGFVGGSEATNSPITDRADGDTIAGSFPSATLAIGETITMTGQFNISGNTGAIAGNNLRFGLFDAAAPPTTGDGTGYTGAWASAMIGGKTATGDGSATNPFSTSATVDVGVGSGGSPVFGTTYDMSISVTRIDATQIQISAGVTDGSLTNTYTTPSVNPANGSFTFDRVAILMGGSLDATTGTFSNIEVNVVPEPGACMLGALGVLAVLRRRR